MPRIIFFNTGWMDSYAGNHRNLDTITGGGAHTREQGWEGGWWQLHRGLV
ncbi:hypothetical protein [Hymenobacter sp. 102]